MGVGLGGLGAVLGSEQLAAPASIVAFVMAAGILLLVAFGDRGVLRIPVLGMAVPHIMSGVRALSPMTRAAMLGVITPLLPCGLLWAAFAAASVAGSAAGGATVMTAFALGTLPLLFLAQSQAGRFAHRFGPRTVQLVQRGAMLLAAVALVWRGYANLQGASCCH